MSILGAIFIAYASFTLVASVFIWWMHERIMRQSDEQLNMALRVIRDVGAGRMSADDAVFWVDECYGDRGSEPPSWSSRMSRWVG